MKKQLCLVLLITILIVVNSKPVNQTKQPKTIVVVPPRCSEGEHLTADGKCVETWGRKWNV